MTTPKKGQEKTRPERKKPAGISADINMDRTELIDDELKKVTGGSISKKTAQDDWNNG